MVANGKTEKQKERACDESSRGVEVRLALAANRVPDRGVAVATSGSWRFGAWPGPALHLCPKPDFSRAPLAQSDESGVAQRRAEPGPLGHAVLDRRVRRQFESDGVGRSHRGGEIGRA